METWSGQAMARQGFDFWGGWPECFPALVMAIGEQHLIHVPAERRAVVQWALYDARHHWNEYQLMCEEGCVHRDGEPYSMKDLVRVVVIRSDTPEDVLNAYMNAKNTDSQRAWEINDVDILYQAEAARAQCVKAHTQFDFKTWAAKKMLQVKLSKCRLLALAKVYEVLPVVGLHRVFALVKRTNASCLPPDAIMTALRTLLPSAAAKRLLGQAKPVGGKFCTTPYVAESMAECFHSKLKQFQDGLASVNSPAWLNMGLEPRVACSLVQYAWAWWVVHGGVAMDGRGWFLARARAVQIHGHAEGDLAVVDSFWHDETDPECEACFQALRMLAYLPFLEEEQADVRLILHGCIEAYHGTYEDPEGMHSQGTIAGYETRQCKATRLLAREEQEEFEARREREEKDEEEKEKKEREEKETKEREEKEEKEGQGKEEKGGAGDA